jgi:16S rRNA (adenine1518-N6/adenine1519-N6)-dimethyltransferase
MTLPSIAQHAKSHGIVPNKKLGQNFLFDLSLCDKIVKTSGNIKDKIILEVGPGPAGLSRAILACGPKKLFAIEKDQRCIALLEEIKEYFPQLEIMSMDALHVKLSSLGTNKITIIANLPYNIGTELLFRWLDEIEYIESITIMLQKEVVDRICANPGSKAYGKLSIMCQLICNVEKEFDVSPAAFFPPPKVTSSIIRITPKEIIPTRHVIDSVRKITSLAFNQRRKMLRSSLKPLAPDLEAVLQKCEINPQDRAENLSIDDYVRLATHY